MFLVAVFNIVFFLLESHHIRTIPDNCLLLLLLLFLIILISPLMLLCALFYSFTFLYAHHVVLLDMCHWVTLYVMCCLHLCV